MRWLALSLLLLVPVMAGAAGLSPEGTRAFEMARAADDAAGVAVEEGGRASAALSGLESPRDLGAAVSPWRAEADGAQGALGGYRRQAQASAGEALALLAEAARLGPAPAQATRREVLEARALLLAHEATVMAARARTEAERLRALLAEARLALVSRPSALRPAAPAPGRIAVPNLIGGRLEAVSRDLASAGLKLGAVSGPRDGHVVRQEPEADVHVPPETPVAVTLSATAATSAPAPVP